MKTHHHPDRCHSFFLSLATLVLTAAFADSAAATYHPALGRWVQRDPMGYVDGPSLYQYVRSMPNALTDPQGLQPVPPPPPTPAELQRQIQEYAQGAYETLRCWIWPYSKCAIVAHTYYYDAERNFSSNWAVGRADCELNHAGGASNPDFVNCLVAAKVDALAIKRGDLTFALGMYIGCLALEIPPDCPAKNQRILNDAQNGVNAINQFIDNEIMRAPDDIRDMLRPGDLALNYRPHTSGRPPLNRI